MIIKLFDLTQQCCKRKNNTALRSEIKSTTLLHLYTLSRRTWLVQSSPWDIHYWNSDLSKQYFIPDKTTTNTRWYLVSPPLRFCPNSHMLSFTTYRSGLMTQHLWSEISWITAHHSTLFLVSHCQGLCCSFLWSLSKCFIYWFTHNYITNNPFRSFLFRYQ